MKKTWQHSRPESRRSDTPNVDAVQFDRASADAAFDRFKDFTRRLLKVRKSDVEPLTHIERRKTRR